MKRLFYGLILTMVPLLISAQDTTAINDTTEIKGPWSTKGMASLNFSQVSLTNWAQGGESSYAINSLTAFSMDYNKEKSSWSNSLDAGYGIQKVGEKRAGKTDDHLEIVSRYGYQTSRVWFLSGILNLKTQFSKGYKVTDTDRIMISDFMSPGYIQMAIGMEYKPNDNFFISLSPVGGKITIVTNDSLSSVGSFGVKPGETMRSEFGGSIKVGVNKDIMENVNFTSTLDLFSNYLNNPDNIDISWRTMINMKINKYLSANISTHLLYDDDIGYTDGEGVNHGPRVQFKELLGIGFSVQF